MEIKYKKILENKDSKILLPVFKNLNLHKDIPKDLTNWLQARQKDNSFSAGLSETIQYFNDNQTFILLGMDEAKALTPVKVRNAFTTAIKNFRSKKNSELAIFIPEELNDFLQEIGEAVMLANYNLATYKTGDSKKESLEKIIKKVILISASLKADSKSAFEKGITIAEGVNYVRDLVNGPSNIISPDFLTEEAKIIAKKHKYKLTVLDKKQLEKLKMGALLGVNAGSPQPARLLVLEYSPLGKKQDPIALVGKGITFDTGGLNLKPSNGIDGMKIDMAGAAVVLGIFQLLSELKIEKNVVGLMPITDNSIDAFAQKPNDIVTAYNGLTIEINNTDAEGRLILADAISYAVEKYKPSRIVDLATLTGACMVALGEQQAGLFGNNELLLTELKSAATETDEELWQLPIHEFHRKEMKGTISDLVNVGTSGYGGASTAAAFLENFVAKTDWAHLDIAGVTKPKKTKDIDFPGSATGYGVRLLIRFLENIK